MKLAAILALLLMTGCLDHNRHVKAYQQRATDKCLAAGNSVEQCRPLQYPSGR